MSDDVWSAHINVNHDDYSIVRIFILLNFNLLKFPFFALVCTLTHYAVHPIHLIPFSILLPVRYCSIQKYFEFQIWFAIFGKMFYFFSRCESFFSSSFIVSFVSVAEQNKIVIVYHLNVWLPIFLSIYATRIGYLFKKNCKICENTITFGQLKKNSHKY